MPAAECPGFVKVGEPLGQPENVVHYQTLLKDCPTLVTDWASVAWWLSKQNCDVSKGLASHGSGGPRICHGTDCRTLCASSSF